MHGMSSVLPQPSNPTASISAAEAAAAVSAAAAANSAGIATAQAGIATTKAGQAAASAAAALASEGIASGAASTATTQAGIATAQAGITTTKAGEAAASAAAALVSEGTASGAAATATTQAGIATTKAGEASASAAAALVSEQNAAATLAGSVRFDVAQPSITPAQQQTARTNIGVVTAGGVAAMAGEMTPATGIAATDFSAYAHTEGSVTGVLLRIVHAGGTYDVLGDDARFGTAKSRGVEYYAASGQLIFFANGVAHATTQALSAGSVVISKVLSAATGTLRSSAIFNRALTAEERSAVMRGEVPAALAKAAITRTNPNATLSGWGPATSSNPTDVTVSGADLGYPTYVGFGTTSAVVVGEVYRFSFTTSNPPAGGMTINGIVFNDGSFGVTQGPAVAAIHDGGNKWHIDVAITTAGASSMFVLQLSWSGTVTQAFTGFRVERIGTVARYEPENVTSLGRWLDSSGNGYDLIPGSGITPLKPQPRQRRGFNCVYDMASMQVIDGASLPPGWSITKPNTGVLHVIAPDYVRDGASLRVDAVSEGDPPSRVTCSGYGYRAAGQAQQYYLYVDALDAPHAPVDAMLSLSVSYDD